VRCVVAHGGVGPPPNLGLDAFSNPVQAGGSALSRSLHAHARRYLGRAARLSATLGLGAVVMTSAVALPASAETVNPVLRDGTTKIVPVAKKDRKVVTVKRGDTLSGLAKAAKLSSWRPIWDVNPKIEDPNLIQPGWKLTIPAKGEETRHRPLPAVIHLPTVSASGTSKAVLRSSSAPRQATTVAGSTVWDRLAQCESGGNWSTSTGNGYSGGLQFSPGTWRANGGSGSAHNASRSEQIAVAKRVLASQGWGAWPACSSKLGLR
jgi:resuscitation-promoting factor RpfA